MSQKEKEEPEYIHNHAPTQLLNQEASNSITVILS